MNKTFLIKKKATEKNMKKITIKKKEFSMKNTVKLVKVISIVMLLSFATKNVNAQFKNHFNCDKDKLDEEHIRISPDPMELEIGQSCVITVFDRKGDKITDNDFIISGGKNVKSNGSSFRIVIDKNDYKPWDYLKEDNYISIEGIIKLSHKKCINTYEFPFRVIQKYIFDRGDIVCKGEKKEFAVARYNNELGKDLYVVLDITKNQLYLFESSLHINASGKKGANGIPGKDGKKGVAGTADSHHGGNGSDGSDGGNGVNGGNGGEITIYLSPSMDISVDVSGGEGGSGGKGGNGGAGGIGYSKQTGTKEVKTILGKTKTEPVITKFGKDGNPGRDGREGMDGRSGQEGTFKKIPVDNIKKYFEKVNQANFNIDNIDED